MNNIFLRLTIALLILVTSFSINVNAQTANSCANAIALSPSPSFVINNFSISGPQTEMWFSFYANSTSVVIEITPPDSLYSPAAHIHGLRLYQGNCLSISALDSVNVADSLITGRQQPLVLHAANLIPGNLYVFNLTKETSSTCANQKCESGASWFGIVIQSIDLTSTCTEGHCDCSDAITPCGSFTFSLGLGEGSVNDIPQSCTYGNPSTAASCQGQFNTHPGGGNNSGCLQNGETNSTWILLTITSSGTLGFTFGAYPQAQYGEYDWIMYPYNSSTGCSDINQGDVAPITVETSTSEEPALK